ncbi:hypothetical protein BpHYR1_012151 [Brachionus plicatilis]|uniref:Uncharacterized protein n=1 Tax=Brachionus plicatilis TaxID=10195 RepID=A0A3M7R8A9_BRAPC|nr:hypothetical protein BpHYR1_012151 [Brachionus plicatilis]
MDFLGTKLQCSSTFLADLKGRSGGIMCPYFFLASMLLNIFFRDAEIFEIFAIVTVSIFSCCRTKK